jgi:hypothetical protein
VAQQSVLDDHSAGFDSRIVRRLAGVLPHLLPGRAVITTNAGAANPTAAARAIVEMMREVGLGSTPVAAVSGDDVLDRLDLREARVWGSDDTLWDLRDRIISANAYVGSAPIIQALSEGARIVITGRCADASLFVAPLAHHFGWDLRNLDIAAEASLVGHLLECAGQLTGGYFADTRRKKVDGLWNLGFPYADVAAQGIATYSKLPGTGGLIDRQTVLEQLLYEIDDPRDYKTPDVNLDLSSVNIKPLGANVVQVSGARAAGVPEQLKVSVGVRDGFLAIAEISYSGTDCVQRAQLAAQIVQERWEAIHRFDSSKLEHTLVGVNASRPWWTGAPEPAEVRLRLSTRTFDRQIAVVLCHEVEALYTNGPYGGGGVVTSIRETTGIISTLVPRDVVSTSVQVFQ